MKRVWDFENHADSIAITGMNGETLTYTELSALSGSLFGSDKSPGLVLMLSANTIGAIAGYAAALYASHPVMLLSSELSHDLIKHVLKTYRPPFLMIPGKLLSDYPNMKIMGQCFDYTLLLTNYPPADINPELAVRLSTSGSTG